MAWRFLRISENWYARPTAPVRTVRQPCAATRCSDGVVALRLGEPQDAINVFDFEPVAYKNVPPAGLSSAFVRKA
jgi:hypothetical protein